MRIPSYAHTEDHRRIWRHVASIMLFLTMTSLCVVEAQQQTPSGQANQSPSLGATTQNGTGQGMQGNNGSTNAHVNGSSLAGNQTNVTTIAPSSTPTTFPLAALPTSGALLGTFQAPFPANDQGKGGAALGPDDHYIASAIALLPLHVPFASMLVTLALLSLTGALFL